MTTRSAPAAYRVECGVLIVGRELRQDHDLAFEQACAALLAEEGKALVIDLRAVSYISSTYIGMIAAAFFQARAAGRTLSIRAGDSVLRVLEAAGFAGLIALERG